jgi:hypothetical protein
MLSLLHALVSTIARKSHSRLFCIQTSTSTILGSDLITKYLPNSTIPLADDLRCIRDRQVFGAIDGIFAVESSRCKYSYPQAFIRFPVGTRISSGMLRLSCPLLVKAIDEWEADGGIEYLNLQVSKNESLRNNFNETNLAWKNIRINSVNKNEIETIRKAFGDEGCENILNCGIIGVSQNKTDDIKCIHAHVADYLLRGGEYLVVLLLFNYYS